jgi:hypothetical protein
MKLEIFLDEKKIKKSNICEDAIEYKEELDEFVISPNFFDRNLVEISLGFGEIILQKEQFEKALSNYRQEYAERTVQYHLEYLLNMLDSEDKDKAKIAIRVLKEKLKGHEEREE